MASPRSLVQRTRGLLAASLLVLSASCGGGGGSTGGGGTQNVAPVITAQPQSLSVSVGSPASFSVTASGTPGPTYQWRKNGTAIQGAVASSYGISAVQSTDAASYDVVATNAAGSATSATAVLTVTPPNLAPTAPVIVGPTTAITFHPAFYNLSATDPEGDAITYVVNGTSIAGSTFMFNPTTAGANVLSVVAKDSKGASSTASTLTVNVAANRPPQFTSPASGQKTGSANPFTWDSFQVVAQDPDTDGVVYSLSGTATIVDNTGATVPGSVTIHTDSGLIVFTGTLAPSRTSAIATFTVKAEDKLPGTSTLLGASATQNVTLTYTSAPDLPPTITSQPQSLIVNVSEPAAFSVTASGSTPFTYQWRKNGSNIPGAAASSFTLPAAGYADAGIIDVVVGNALGNATSSPATLQVITSGGGVNLLQNQGFEDGRVNWGSSDLANIIDNQATPVSHTGGWKAWIGGYDVPNVDTLFQDFTIPSAATSASLSFWVKVATQEPGAAQADVMVVQLRNPATNAVVAALGSFSNLDATSAYALKSFDLLAYKGQNLRLYFAGTTNLGAITSWFLDDLSLAVVSPSGLKPIVASFTPIIGPPGTLVTVTGSAFFSLNGVAFNGVGAAFTLDSPTQLTVTVPDSATTGQVSVTNTAGTGISASSFTVLPPLPTITDFDPNTGTVGTPVILTGTKFTGATAVRFNGTSATFTVNSDTKITTEVPIGATTGSISVETPNGIGTSARKFGVNTGGGGLDLVIDSLYISQATQTYTRTVPLVKGRNGFLRVFVKANQANTATPSVRVRIQNNAILVSTYTIPAPGVSVPTSISEGSLNSSWNLALPGSDIQPGFTILVDVDPTNAIPEGNETNNSYPASGTPLALSPVTVQILRATVIPVTQGGLTGNVNAINLDAWTDRARRMYPIEAMDTVLGTGYTSSVSLLEAGAGWSTLLSEIENKRVMDGNQSTRYYFGAVATSYASGVAGLGYVPLDSASTASRSALGWDKTGYLDGGNFPEVYAHELGHNLGRFHAPCGDPANVDPNYPYATADIGVFGYDLTANSQKEPGTYKDIMAYCTPDWISDYTYKGLLTWRQNDAVHLPPPDGTERVAAQEAARDVVVVWGRLEQGVWTLEPVFHAQVPASPMETGETRIEGFDAAGNPLFSRDFQLVAPGCGATLPGEGHFNLAIPLSAELRSRLARVAVTKHGLLMADRRPSPLVRFSPARPVSARVYGNSTDLVWDDGAYPMAAIRDPRTGEILAFARGGFMALPKVHKDLEVLLSDGIQVTSQRVQAAE